MIENITFDREELIIKSNVRSVFVPNKPIDSIELFCGRQDEVSRILECIGTKGMHLLLYGDRGVGKTSLSHFTCKTLLSKYNTQKYYVKICDRGDSFVSIIKSLFDDLNIKCIVKDSKSWRFSILGNLLTLTNGGNKEYITYDDINSPSWVAKKIHLLSGIFLIDEVDVLKNKEDKEKLAELIKHLSDYHSKFTIFIVGISKTASDLIGGHPSVQRCIKEVRLGRMTDTELYDIIKKGEEHLKLSFSKEVKRIIIKASAGFPYFTHLLSLKSAEESIAKGLDNVTKEEFKLAVRRAVDDLEGSLKENYNKAIIGQKIERKRSILLAAAICGEDLFTAKQLKDNYAKICKKEISQQELNNSLSSNIISDGYTTILRRISKGIYIFNDPRMPSFIRLINNYIE